MPELPEVERAAALARAATIGKDIESVTLLHPALERRAPASSVRALAGARVEGITRRGKHQLVELADGRTIHVHFRMSGDWSVIDREDPLPRHARATIALADGPRLVLVDPRALATLTVHEPGRQPLPELGPEPWDPELTPETLATQLARRRGPIKPTLLDQRMIAGVGNIYASEALWSSRISPRARASAISLPRLRRLLGAVRRVLRAASGDLGRYRDAPTTSRFAVYDREGKACRRCGHRIARIVQAGRSTYLCRHCQRR